MVSVIDVVYVNYNTVVSSANLNCTAIDLLPNTWHVDLHVEFLKSVYCDVIIAEPLWIRAVDVTITNSAKDAMTGKLLYNCEIKLHYKILYYTKHYVIPWFK